MSSSRPGWSPDRAPVTLRGARRVRRWLRHDDRGLLLLLVALTAAGSVAIVRTDNAPGSLLIVPVFLGGIMLSPKWVPPLVALVFVAMVVLLVVKGPHWDEQGVLSGRLVTFGLITLMSLVTLLVTRTRTALGVPGVRGESMLLELRDRLRRHGEVPALPAGWSAETSTRSAGGASFAGDFMVTRLSDDRRRLNVAVVDVSGKGVDAGTRALLLSGAFGGLLGAVPSADFLPQANRFLLQQDWPEGFATAVHLHVDLVTGDFELRSAGHPPPVQLLSGSGRWVVHDALEGPVLGVVPGAEFCCVTGRLRSGDALLLYTDGLVEKARRDISLGIDRLLGESERLLSRGFDGAAEALVHRLGASDDDCALLVLHRR